MSYFSPHKDKISNKTHSEPYAWDISAAVQAGENTLEITAANTLVNRIHDRFSIYLQLLPSGVMGPVMLKKQN